jgi:hypothetical protein
VALNESFEAPELNNVKERVFYFAIFIEVYGYSSVSLHAGYRIDGDFLFHSSCFDVTKDDLKNQSVIAPIHRGDPVKCAYTGIPGQACLCRSGYTQAGPE